MKAEVHLWHAYVGEQDVDRRAEQYLSLLNVEEREQSRRFRFSADRDRYLVTRALVRIVLARYAPIAARDWQFEKSAYGRPQVANDDRRARRVCFNISHTNTLVLMAVAIERRLGVDVEDIRRTVPLGVAERCFSRQEVDGLRRLAGAAQASRFWDLWTFKESYVKARGMGLSLPLDKVSFEFDRDSRVTVAFDEGLNDRAENWEFFQLRSDDCHRVALCLAGPHPAGTEIRCFRMRLPGDAAAVAPAVVRMSRGRCGEQQREHNRTEPM